MSTNLLEDEASIVVADSLGQVDIAGNLSVRSSESSTEDRDTITFDVERDVFTRGREILTTPGEVA